MAENVELKIVLSEDQVQAPAPGGTAISGGATVPTPTFDVMDQAQKMLDAWRRRQEVLNEFDALLGREPPAALRADPLTNVDQAREMMEAYRQRAAVDAERYKLMHGDYQEVLRGELTIVEEAQKAMEAYRKRAAIDAERHKLMHGEYQEVLPGEEKWGGSSDFLKAILQSQTGFGRAAGNIQTIQEAGGLGGIGKSLAGGAGGMAAAAGPIGAVVALATQAKDMIVAGINQIGELAKSAGRMGEALAGNDFAGLTSEASEAMASLVEKTGLAGEVMAAQIRAMMAVIQAYQQVAQAFIDRGRELSGYQGDLAQATAIADVRRLQADIREAQELGPAIARLTDAQSRADAELRELLLPIKEAIIQEMIPILELIASALRGLNRMQRLQNEGMKAGVEATIGALKGDFTQLGMLLTTEFIERLRRAWKGEEEQGIGFDLLQQIQIPEMPARDVAIGDQGLGALPIFHGQ